MGALNINEFLDCDKCANQDECRRTSLMMPLLVMLKNGCKCDAFKYMTEEERNKRLYERGELETQPQP